MGITLKTGRFVKAQLGKKGCLAMLHGGAGPADPKGEKSLYARTQLKKMAGSLASLNVHRISPCLRDKIQGQSLAEAFCLQAVRLLEEEPCLNAGRGAALQADGVPRVSAGFMESRRQRLSGVMNVENILCPSELAYYLQFERYSLMDAQGAARLALELGVPQENLVTEERFAAWQAFKAKAAAGSSGTVGVVGVAADNSLAAVTSTGGLGNEQVGRVGDSPTVAGTYCDGATAVSCTGVGEQIISQAFAAKLAIRVHEGLKMEQAFMKGLEEAHARAFEFGAIAVSYDRSSEEVVWAAGTTTSAFLWAVHAPDGWIYTEM